MSNPYFDEERERIDKLEEEVSNLRKLTLLLVHSLDMLISLENERNRNDKIKSH